MNEDAWTARLRDVLGAPLLDLTEAHLRNVVARAVREDEDLDFKRELYGSSDGQRKDLSGDIAALANYRGGVLLLGVEETDGAASRLCPVVLSDGEERRVKQIAAAGIAPHVAFDVLSIRSDSNSAQGYYALAVPPSANRPHAVRVDGRNLRYPRRDGTTTRWLAEAEIADLYRDRFSMVRSQIERLDEVMLDGLSHTVREATRDGLPDTASDKAWVSIAITPSSKGAMRIGIVAQGRMREWAEQFRRPELLNDFLYDAVDGPIEVRVGVGRLILRSPADTDKYPTRFIAELHADGSAYAAWASGPASQLEQTASLGGIQLTSRTTSALRLLGAHAVDNAGAYGDALTEVRVTGEDVKLVLIDNVGGSLSIVRAPLTSGPVISRHTLSLAALRGTHADRLLSTRILLTDVMQFFGIAELREVAEAALFDFLISSIGASSKFGHGTTTCRCPRSI